MRALGISALIAFSGGCAQVVSYHPGHAPQVVKAQATGVYDLFARGQHGPVYDIVLLKGDRIGFARTSSGQLVSVAAADRHPIPEAKYSWRFRPNPGSTAPKIGTGQLIAGLAGKLFEAAIDGAINSGLENWERHSEEQGLTRYQKKKLRQSEEQAVDP